MRLEEILHIPVIITGSRALSFLHCDLLAGEGLPSPDGVEIIILRAPAE